MKNSNTQGHGISGRYGGLKDPFGEESFSQIVILPVPFDRTTTYQKGAKKGPKALIEASRNMELYDIETDSEVYLRGIHTAKAIRTRVSEKMLERVYERTRFFLEKEKFVVLVGGEHSITFGAIRAFGEHFKKLTLLHLDAHADLQPAYIGNPYSHASVMARVKELPYVEKIVSVAIRSMSAEEKPYLDFENTFFAHQLDEKEKWMGQVLEKLSSPLYITFDLDAFDSSLMPSTGTPEPGGLFWNQTLKFLKLVAKNHDIVGFDVVELCPQRHNLAPDFVAAKLIYKLLSYKFARKL